MGPGGGGRTTVTRCPAPRSLVPAKNSTLTTSPSGSAAKAKNGKSSGARRVVSLAGLVMRTTGGRFVGGGGGPGWGGMLTASETLEAPPLSVALAVSRTFVPGGALLQTSTNGRNGGIGGVTEITP